MTETDDQPALVSINAKVGTSEIVDIKVAQLETRLLALETNQTKTLTAAKKAQEKRCKAFEKELTRLTRLQFAEEISHVEALAGAGANISATPEIEPPEGLNRNGERLIDVPIDLTEEAPTSLTISLAINLGGYSETETNKRQFNYKQLTTQHEEIRKAQEDITALSEKLLETKKALTKISRAERQLRGRLAQYQLNQTKEGQQILEDLDVDWNDVLPNLPQLPEPK